MLNLFEGVTVLDFTNNTAGPTATAFMADFGALVIKVERPGTGDDTRGWIEFIEGKALAGMWHNRGKKSLTLDTKNPEAIAILKEIVKKADVVVESFRPGVMAKMGLGYADLVKINPKIIMTSISAFGQYGPYSQMPGYDIMVQAMSGLMSLTGPAEQEPYKAGVAIGDFCGGFHAFGATSAALFHRERTGKGQHVDISLLDGLMVANEYAENAWNGFEVKRSGNTHSMIAPFGLFKGNGGALMIAGVSDILWAKLCTLMDKQELINDPVYSNPGKRAQVVNVLIPMIEEWLKTFPDIDAAKKVLDDNGVPSAKVYTLKDVMTDPHVLAREMVVDIAVPEISQGKIKGRGNPLKFSECKAKLGQAPALGEHNADILTQLLGYSADQLEKLKNNKVFG
ncbi:MAG: CaiB/BaiF CoA transferase family protein [Negativicutes bacterium]